MNKGWKKLGAAAIIGLLIIVIAGCVEEGKVRTPEDTIEEFVNYYNDRDADSLYALFSDKVRSEHPIEEIESNLEAAKTFGVKITKWEIVGKEEIGNVVILKVSTTTEGGFSPGTEIHEFFMILENKKRVIDTWCWEAHDDTPAKPELTPIDTSGYKIWYTPIAENETACLKVRVEGEPVERLKVMLSDSEGNTIDFTYVLKDDLIDGIETVYVGMSRGGTPKSGTYILVIKGESSGKIICKETLTFSGVHLSLTDVQLGTFISGTFETTMFQVEKGKYRIDAVKLLITNDGDLPAVINRAMMVIGDQASESSFIARQGISPKTSKEIIMGGFLIWIGHGTYPLTIKLYSGDTEIVRYETRIKLFGSSQTEPPTSTSKSRIEGLDSFWFYPYWANWDTDPEKDGYEFRIWFYDARGNRIHFSDTPVDVTVKLYGRFYDKDLLDWVGPELLRTWDITITFSEEVIHLPYEGHCEKQERPPSGSMEVIVHTP